MAKFLNIFFLVLFLVFALVQINDPDPLFWVLFYLLVATVFLLKLLGKEIKKLALAVILIAIATSLYHVTGFYEWLTLPDKAEIFGEMVYKKPYIEETREFLGSLIAAACLLTVYLRK